MDWASTALGPTDQWPTALRNAVSVVLNSAFPMVLRWGPEFIQIYNDAYLPIIGQRHPAAMGRPAQECWPEVWEFSLAMYRRALAGEVVYLQDQSYRLVPRGNPAMLYVNACYSPLYDEHGEARGVLTIAFDTTAQRAASDSLAASEERLRMAADAGDIGTWDFKPRTGELFWDERVMRHFGLSPGTPTGYETFLAGLHPEDREAADNAVQQTIANPGSDFDIEYRTIGLDDGIERWIGAKGTALADAKGRTTRFIGTTTNITVRKRTEDALRESERRHRFRGRLADLAQGLTDPSDIMAMTVRLLGEHLHATRCAYADVETDADHFTIRQDWTDGAPSSVGVYHLDLFGARAAGDMRAGRTLIINDVEQELANDEGARMFLEIGIRAIVCCPLVRAGKLVAMMAVHQSASRRWLPTDIALIVEVVDRSWAHIERLRSQVRLREQDRRKDEFLATLAHELRNPLAPLRAGLQILKISKSPDADRKAREMMERQLAQMVRLIDDLLDVSRVTQGKVVLKKALTSIRAIVENALETSLPLVEAEHHELAVRLPREPLFVDVDATRLAQVVGNLVNNAAKYTPPGGHIEIAAESVGPHVVISVKDDGLGIPRDMQSKVFDLFSQVSRSLERAQGGLGIGLSLVRRLVEMHGGEVSVFSAGPNQGSTFRVTLPLVSAPQLQLADAMAVTHPGADERSLRVLIVDDNADAAESLVMLVELYGHGTRMAHSGPDALTAVALYTPHVVFLDIGMPGMSGYDVAREICKDAQPPVLIALTGWGTDEDKQRAYDSGFDYHVTKPAEPERVQLLLAEIAKALSLRARG